MLSGCEYSHPPIGVHSCYKARICTVYRGVPYHIGVGSDVVHSLELGNARALCSGMNNR
jgi:hypothetical protein